MFTLMSGCCSNRRTNCTKCPEKNLNELMTSRMVRGRIIIMVAQESPGEKARLIMRKKANLSNNETLCRIRNAGRELVRDCLD